MKLLWESVSGLLKFIVGRSEAETNTPAKKTLSARDKRRRIERVSNVQIDCFLRVP